MLFNDISILIIVPHKLLLIHLKYNTQMILNNIEKKSPDNNLPGPISYF